MPPGHMASLKGNVGQGGGGDGERAHGGPRLISEGAPRKERLQSHMERSGKVKRFCAHRPGQVKPKRRTGGEYRRDGKQRPFLAPGATGHRGDGGEGRKRAAIGK